MCISDKLPGDADAMAQGPHLENHWTRGTNSRESGGPGSGPAMRPARKPRAERRSRPVMGAMSCELTACGIRGTLGPPNTHVHVTDRTPDAQGRRGLPPAGTA